MDVSNILIILVVALLLALAAAALINGIFITTRGETVTGPDGEQRDQDAMIFYSFQKLICTRSILDEVVYYKGDHLIRLLRRIHKAFPPLSESNYMINESDIIFKNRDDLEAWQHSQILQWMEHNDIHMGVTLCEENNFIRFSAHYPRYILPSIIRKPLVQCVKCMASFWGSVIWWGTVLPIYGWHPHWQLAGWVAFCFVTAYLSSLLYKKATS